MSVESWLQSVQAELVVLGQAVIALVLGGVLGWEREAAGKWAGLRTHMLVCLAALLFVKVGQFLIVDSRATINETILRTDPVRIIEAIVTGIAFLGGGVIFRNREGNAALGLTTAATLLTVAPIGVAVALELYTLAVGVTLLVLFVLRGVRLIETSFYNPRGKPPLDETD